MSDDIQIDNEDTPKPAKVKSGVPVWMPLLVIITFICFTALLVLQWMEYKYHRGAPLMEKDEYATQVALPPA